MMLYNLVGILSSLLFIACLWGLYIQINKIKFRRQKYDSGVEKIGYATKSMSINGFFSSFIAFYAFFLYSIFLDNIDYFIFFTRLLAALVTLYILFLIYKDRVSFRDKWPFMLSLLAMIASFGVLFFREESMVIGKNTSLFIIIGSTIIMFQGGVAQILTIFKQRCTGALSLKMNAIFFAKDVMNIVFGLVIGLSDGWPLILMGAVSALLKLTIIVQFYIYPQEPEEVLEKSVIL